MDKRVELPEPSGVMSDDLRNHAHPRGARTGHDRGPSPARAPTGNTRAGRPTTRYPARR